MMSRWTFAVTLFVAGCSAQDNNPTPIEPDAGIALDADDAPTPEPELEPEPPYFAGRIVIYAYDYEGPESPAGVQAYAQIYKDGTCSESDLAEQGDCDFLFGEAGDIVVSNDDLKVVLESHQPIVESYRGYNYNYSNQGTSYLWPTDYQNLNVEVAGGPDHDEEALSEVLVLPPRPNVTSSDGEDITFFPGDGFNWMPYPIPDMAVTVRVTGLYGDEWTYYVNGGETLHLPPETVASWGPVGNFEFESEVTRIATIGGNELELVGRTNVTRTFRFMSN